MEECNIVKVKINGEEEHTIDARLLYERLGSGQHFSTWIKSRLKKFDKDIDYFSHNKIVEREIGATRRIDYTLTLHTAKRIALKENNEQGEKIRQYFIKFEQEAKKVLLAHNQLNDPILKHKDIRIQKENSKMINALNFKKGGVLLIKEHNTELCKILTNKTPKEVKEIAKQRGLKSCQRTSAKEVLRHICPPKAEAMSFTEELLKKHPDKTVFDLKNTALQATRLYSEIQNAGISVEDFSKKQLSNRGV